VPFWEGGTRSDGQAVSRRILWNPNVHCRADWTPKCVIRLVSWRLQRHIHLLLRLILILSSRINIHVLTVCWLLGALVPPQKWVTLVGASCGLGITVRLLAVTVNDCMISGMTSWEGADILSVISGLSDLGLTCLYTAPDYRRGTVVGSNLVSIEFCYGFRGAEFVITSADVRRDSCDTYSFIKSWCIPHFTPRWL
jgi:hypothetical protein